MSFIEKKKRVNIDGNDLCFTIGISEHSSYIVPTDEKTSAYLSILGREDSIKLVDELVLEAKKEILNI